MPKVLADLAEISPQVPLPRNATQAMPVSFIPMSDVTESGEWVGHQVRALGDVRNGFTEFADGDILVAKITPCFENGKGAHVSGLVNGVGFGSTEFHVLRARDGASPRFIHHLVQSDRLRRCAEAQMSGSAGQRRVPRDFFETYAVPDLGRAEQVKIAQILDALDTTIRQTEEVIEKLKQAKQGLLHDLLTRGIDANGELRPLPREAPHLYHMTCLGWVPKEWDIVGVGDEVEIRHGFAFPGRQFTAEPLGHRLLVPGNFSRFGGLDFSPENTKYFAGQHPPGTLLEAGEALIVMTDLSPLTLILGRAVLLGNDFPVLHNQRIGRFVFRNSGAWNSEYFVMAMNDNRLRRRVIAEATGTTVRHTSPDRIKAGHIAKPSAEEQAAVVQCSRTLSSRIAAETATVAKQREIKSGLTDDLLMCRTRSNVLFETVAA